MDQHAGLEELKELIQSPHFFRTPKNLHPRLHAKELDQRLGFHIPKIEQKLLRKYQAYDKLSDPTDRKQHFEGTQAWIGLHPQILQTPYSEILDFLSYLVPFGPQKIIDLGAGYGRVGIVLNALIPNCQFVGYEILPQRFKEARRMFERLELTDCEMRSDNIIADDFTLPSADAYFIYDFSDPHDLRTLLDQLSEKIHNEEFFVIAKGDGVRSLIQHKYPQFYVVNGALHKKNWSLYSSFTEVAKLDMK